MDQYYFNRVADKNKPRPHLGVIAADTKKALAAYYGGEALLDFIPEYSTAEQKGKLDERKRDTVNHYDNFTKEVVNIYVESMFRSKQDSRLIEDSGPGVDRLNEYFRGKYYNWLTNEVVPFSLILDELFCYVEKPAADMFPVHGSQADELELIPEPYLIFPQYVIDYEEHNGRISWVAIACGPNNEDIKMIDAREIVYLLKGKAVDPVYDDMGTPVENLHGYKDEAGRDICPVVKIQFAKNHFYGGKIGYAFMADVINKSVACLQFVSMFIEACEQHLSLKLAMSEDTYQRLGDDLGIGNDRVIKERGGPEYVATRYIALPGIELNTLLAIINEHTPAAIFRSARLRRIGNAQSSNAQSGIAKLMDMLPELDVLARVIEFVWGFDEAICTLIKLGYGPTITKKLKVSYPETVDVRTTAEQMTDVTGLVTAITTGNLPRSKTLDAVIMKNLYSAMLPNLDAKIREVGFKEIDALIETGAIPEQITKQLETALGGKANPDEPAMMQTNQGDAIKPTTPPTMPGHSTLPATN